MEYIIITREAFGRAATLLVTGTTTYVTLDEQKLLDGAGIIDASPRARETMRNSEFVQQQLQNHTIRNLDDTIENVIVEWK